MADPYRFWLNALYAVRFCAGPISFIRYIHWLYASPSWKEPARFWEIAFRLTDAPRIVKLRLRANRGSDRFVWGEVFDTRCYDVPMPQAPKRVLDLGANAGLTTVFFSLLWPEAQIACVEPLPENSVVLRRNIELNAIRARVFEGVAAIKDGECVLQRGRRDGQSSLLDVPDARTDETLRARAWSVPALMRAMDWERIDLAKIDIEGYERVLLSENNQWLAQTDTIVLEAHGAFGRSELNSIGRAFAMNVRRLPSGIWMLQR
jgi:FkbM family methyltransferase